MTALDQIGEAVDPDDDVELLEAGVIQEVTEATDFEDPLELEGADLPAEEAAVFEHVIDPLSGPDDVIEDDLDLVGIRDDDRVFDSIQEPVAAIAIEDLEEVLAEGGDVPTLEGPDPLDGSNS